MYCPQCGQERISRETSFCSRCGFLLTGAAELLLTGGAPLQPKVPGGISPRGLGFRRGLYMFLLMFVLAPIVGMISAFGFGIEAWPVGIVIFGLGGGGILRMIYAFLFESGEPSMLAAGPSDHIADPSQLDPARAQFLPPQREQPAAQQTASWMETSDLQPHSVTDPTTRLLKKEK